MGRTGLLFLLIGLAAGLWLGFNPTTHRDLVRWWNREVASEASGKPVAGLSARQLNSRLARSLRSSPQPLAQPEAQRNTVPTWNQIVAELHAFWLALEQVWLNFLAQLHIRS